MNQEWGLFNDEGMVEGDFYSYQEAVDAIAKRYSDEDDLEVYQVCPHHREEPMTGCEQCWADEVAEDGLDDEDEDDEEDEAPE